MQHIREYIHSKKQIWISACFFSLCVTVFLMPFPRSWSLYPLGIFLFSGIFMWIEDYNSLKLAFIRKLPLILPPVTYFALHIVGFLIKDPKWKYLEGNLMFILVPVFGFPLLKSDMFLKNLHIFLKSFIYGILIICVFEFVRAAWQSFSYINGVLGFNPDIDSTLSWFRSDQLSFLEHPTYLSLKVLFACAILIIFRHDLKMPWQIIVIQVSLLLVFVFFLSSRTGILITLLLFLFFLYHFLKKLNWHLLLIVLAPFILFIGFKIVSLNARIISQTELFLSRYRTENMELKGTDPRFASWFAAIELIKEHPIFGVGLNSKDFLAREYLKNGYTVGADLRLDAHNQFLESQMTFGIAGTLTLLWMLLAPFYKTRKLWKPLLYYSFLIIMVTAFLFESVFVRQWGIMLFVLFYCVQVLLRSPEGD